MRHPSNKNNLWVIRPQTILKDLGILKTLFIILN